MATASRRWPEPVPIFRKPSAIAGSVLLFGFPLFRLLALQFVHRFTRCQFLAGESGIIGCVTIGAEEWSSARRTAATWSARSGGDASSGALHRLKLLSLILIEQLRELRVDFLLHLLQLLLLLGGKLQRILLRGRQNLARLRTTARTTWPGTARRRAVRDEYTLELLFLCCIECLVKPFVNGLLQCSQVLLLSVRQLQSILFGAGHDPAGPRGRTGPAGSWRRPTFGEALVLVGRKEF